MYVAIFAGQIPEEILKFKTMSEVLLKTLNIVNTVGLGETTKIYDSREAFLESIGQIMQDDHEGYVIGVDVDSNSFEILHIKYDWIYEVVKSENEN